MQTCKYTCYKLYDLSRRPWNEKVPLIEMGSAFLLFWKGQHGCAEPIYQDAERKYLYSEFCGLAQELGRGLYYKGEDRLVWKYLIYNLEDTKIISEGMQGLPKVRGETFYLVCAFKWFI